ncbi:hypothetical protein P7C70_g1284, partial [Phenoliferia sp. Uapishka_3]
MSSADEDDFAPSSPVRPSNLPLSAISEAEDAIGSGSDSDNSSVGAAGARSPPSALVSAVDKQLDRIRISGDSARISDNIAVKSGYLMKKGERRKAWKKRWFVLRGGQVAMYKTDKEYQLLRLIPLTDIHTCAPIEFKKHANTFGIVTPKRTYYVRADSSAEVNDWCTKVERAKEEAKSMATVTSLDTTPGDVTPQGQRTPAGAIPIPSLTGLPVSPKTPNLPIRADGAYSFGTTATSPSPPTPFSANSALSSSFTSTSTAPPSTVGGGGGGPRVPPNSFAAGGAGALGLQDLDGHQLELRGVDAGLETILGAQQRRASSFSGSQGGTSSGGEGASRSRLGVPSSGYFSSRGGSGENVSPGGASQAPSSPGGGPVSSSEDEDGFDGYESFTSPVEAPVTTGGIKFQNQDVPQRRGSNMSQSGKASANTVVQEGLGSGFTDPNKVILSGYLMKQGKRRNWRKRWFVLMSGGLMYSRSHMDSKIHRQIPLARILDAIEFDPTAPQPSSSSRRPLSSSGPLSPSSPASAPLPFEGGAKNYEHCFKIITPKRTYLVCAPSEEDEIAWLAALQCLVARKQGGGTTAAAPTATAMPSASSSAPKRSHSTTSQSDSQSRPIVVTSPSGVSPKHNSGFEVIRGSSTTTATTLHGRQRSVTDAAKAAVREGVASFRESGARAARTNHPSIPEGEGLGQGRAVRAG